MQTSITAREGLAPPTKVGATIGRPLKRHGYSFCFEIGENRGGINLGLFSIVDKRNKGSATRLENEIIKYIESK